MFLNQCIASKAGLLNNSIIDFDRNITVVCGGNDSGKTLVSRSIIDLLFGFSGGNSVLNQGVWDNFYINCLFSVENEQYKIIKNNASTQIFLTGKKEEKLIYDSSIDAEFPDGYRLSPYIHAFNSFNFSVLGYMHTPVDDFPEMNIFREMSEFFLNDSSRFLTTYKRLNDYFSVSGINKNIENILTKKILEHENELRQFEKNLDLNRLKEQKKTKLENEKISLLNEKKIISLRLESIDRNLHNLDRLAELYSEHESKLSEISRLSEKIENEKKLKTSIEDMKENIRKTFPQFAGMNSIQKENFETIQNAYKYIKNLDNELTRTTDDISSRRTMYRRLFFSVTLISITAAASVYFQKYVQMDKNVKIALYALTGCIWAYAALVSGIRTSQLMKSKKIESLRTERQNRCDELFRILRENNLNTEDLTIEEIYELLLQYFEEFGFYTEHEEEIDVLNSSLQDKETYTEFKQKLAEARSGKNRSLENIKTLIDELGLYTDSDVLNYPINQARTFFEEEKSEFTAELNKISELISQINEELDHSASQNGSDSGFETEIGRYRNELNRLELYDRNIRYILSVFDTAIENRKNRIVSEISDNTSLLFNEITSGQYSTTVTSGAIEQFIRTGKMNNLDNKSIPNIIELSMKIAVTDYLENSGLTIPLIIDEPTGYLDRNRIARLKNVLYDFSKKRQIVIFTHDENSFMKFGKRVNL